MNQDTLFEHIVEMSQRKCDTGTIIYLLSYKKSERVWRKSKLTVNRLIFKEHCLKLKVAITKAKTHHYQQSILDCNGDQSKLFKCVHSLLGRSKQCALHDSPASLSTHFNDYFIEKIKAIRKEFPILQSTLPNYVCPESSTTCEPTNCQFLDFTPVTLPEIKTILSQMNITTCLLDPFPTSVLIDSDVWLDWLAHIVNMSLSTGIFPEPLKTDCYSKATIKETYPRLYLF